MVQNPESESRPQPLTVTCDGKPLACLPGTSLAAALWNHDIRQLAHSHKYGRPRGVTCARGHCTNCLMRVDGVPNVRTCETTVRDGMVVTTQDTGTYYGGLMQRGLFLASPWVPVGFYYKWFTRPATVSRLFLERIRPMTGVGRLPDASTAVRALPAAAVDGADPAGATGTDLGRFVNVVIGAGASGLLAAAACSGPTLLIDDFAAPGGQRRIALAKVAASGSGILPRFPLLAAAWQRLEDAANALQSAPQVRFMGGAKAIAGYHPDGLLVRDGERLLTARFDNLVWAAGALDTIGLFPGNDTPGLLGPRALYRLVTRDGLDVRNRHALLVGGGLDFWLSAALLASAGAHVSLVVTESGCQSEVAAAVDLRWPLNTGLKLEEVTGAGEGRLRASFVPRRSAPGPLGSHMRLEADLMVVCGHGKPAYDIPHQLGADLVLVPARGGFVPRGCETTDAAAHTAPLPGGAPLTAVGEALGLQPTELVNR